MIIERKYASEPLPPTHFRQTGRLLPELDSIGHEGRQLTIWRLEYSFLRYADHVEQSYGPCTIAFYATILYSTFKFLSTVLPLGITS